eukprot:scaffold1860_cov403-Prasinococcus_capsulatus_cf.AAC.7
MNPSDSCADIPDVLEVAIVSHPGFPALFRAFCATRAHGRPAGMKERLAQSEAHALEMLQQKCGYRRHQPLDSGQDELTRVILGMAKGHD